jgi:hypothetical protein
MRVQFTLLTSSFINLRSQLFKGIVSQDPLHQFTPPRVYILKVHKLVGQTGLTLDNPTPVLILCLPLFLAVLISS